MREQRWWRNLVQHLETSDVTPSAEQAATAAAVMVALGQNRDTGLVEIVLNKRTETVASHRGQMSFPGGFFEPQDQGTKATALRECFEELAVQPHHLTLLGRLSTVPTRFDVQIFPWVAELELPYDFVANADEVAKLHFLPLDRLLQEGLKEVQVPVGNMLVSSQGIELDGELVWGATAIILSQLREKLLLVHP